MAGLAWGREIHSGSPFCFKNWRLSTLASAVVRWELATNSYPYRSPDKSRIALIAMIVAAAAVGAGRNGRQSAPAEVRATVTSARRGGGNDVYRAGVRNYTASEVILATETRHFGNSMGAGDDVRGAVRSGAGGCTASAVGAAEQIRPYPKTGRDRHSGRSEDSRATGIARDALPV